MTEVIFVSMNPRVLMPELHMLCPAVPGWLDVVQVRGEGGVPPTSSYFTIHSISKKAQKLEGFLPHQVSSEPCGLVCRGTGSLEEFI